MPSGRYFGEIKHRFPDPKGDGFILTVPMFGARRKDDVGSLGSAYRIRQSELDLVMTLLPKLAAAVGQLDKPEKPFAMNGRYLGSVSFLPGWARLADE